MHTIPPLIGSDKAARAYGVDRATFNKWVKAGKVPFVFAVEGHTGARLFDPDVIEQLATAYKARKAGSVEEQAAS